MILSSFPTFIHSFQAIFHQNFNIKLYSGYCWRNYLTNLNYQDKNDSQFKIVKIMILFYKEVSYVILQLFKGKYMIQYYPIM